MKKEGNTTRFILAELQYEQNIWIFSTTYHTKKDGGINFY